MGHLSAFDIPSLKRQYDLKHLFETGTGSGNSIRHVAGMGFSSIHSVEYYELTYKTTSQNLKGIPNLQLHLGHSPEVLSRVLKNIPREEGILFWLDAHFPGAGWGGDKGYDDDSGNEVNLPLFAELDVILAERGGCRDVILIDDLRIIDPINPGSIKGVLPNWKYPTSQRIVDQFGSTHDITQKLQNEGYLVLLPKG